MKMTRILLVTGLCFAFGCSKSDDTETKAGKTNEQQVKQNSQTQAGAIADAVSGNGQTAADSLYSAGSSSQSNVSASSYQGDITALSAGLQLEGRPDEAGCVCDKTAHTCTFTNCKRGSSGSGVTLNGTLNAADGKFKCDLKWDTDSSGGSVSAETHVHVTADMTTSATSIKGTMHTDGSAKISGVNLPDIPGVSSAGGATGTEWTSDTNWDVTMTGRTASAGTVTHNGTYKTGSTIYTGGGTTSFP